MKKAIAIIAIVLFLLVPAAAFSGVSVTQTIDGAPGESGTWTDAITTVFNNTGAYVPGYINVSVYGATWSATVTLQRKFKADATWYDVDSWTSNAQAALTDTEKGVTYRIGVKYEEFTSGSVAVRLSK